MKNLKGLAYVLILQIWIVAHGSAGAESDKREDRSINSYYPVTAEQRLEAVQTSQIRLPDFDSGDVYQTLNFQANWTKLKLFWKSQDFNFEERYLREQTCFSYSSCNLPPLQVFVVPFSHNDPGWIKTFEGYFETKTKFILNNAVEKLTQYPEMTFVWSEISFLSKWWNIVANSTQKRLLKKLVNEGRFEILTGGWIMGDESSPSLFALSHQLIEGHQWLRRNLNYKPSAAWSIDPFGHGNVMPYLLKSSGLQGMMIQRLHYAWKHWLAQYKYGDFIWKQRWDETGEHNIHCLNAPYDLYPTKHACGPTPEVCMKFNFRHIPGLENEEHLSYMRPVTHENIVQLADDLMGQYRRTASLTRHNVVVTGVGNDFEFSDPLEWDQQIHNYDALFRFINSNPDRYNAKVQFGTLSQYFSTLKQRKTELPTFTGDFFPYSDVYFPYPPAYWTGYYSTRPFWKKLSRETEDELRKAEVLFTFTFNYLKQHNHTDEAQVLSKTFNFLVQARRWLALFQHHDGITGTSPRATMIDYAKKLFDAIRFSEHIQRVCVRMLIRRQLLAYQADLGNIEETFANLADRVPLKLPADGTVKKVVLFNSLGWAKSHLVRILVDTPNVMVDGPSGEPVASQMNPKIGISDDGISGIFSGYYELVFIAYLAPFALTTYEVKRAPDTKSNNIPFSMAIPAVIKCSNCAYKVEPIERPYITLDNEQLEVTFDGETGLLKGILRKQDHVSALMNMTYGKYMTGFGSGAYLSRPILDHTIDILASCKNERSSKLFVVSGPVVKEVTVLCKEMMISYYILQQGLPEALSAVYLTNSVKPMGSNYGEFFMSLQTDLETTTKIAYNSVEEPTFFTDNGLGVEKRMKVSRLPYEGNLYPVVNYAYVQDTYTGRRVSVLIDRAHGFTSTRSGHLEAINDRRLPYDDARVSRRYQDLSSLEKLEDASFSQASNKSRLNVESLGMDEGVNDPEDMVSNYVILLEPLPRTAKDNFWKPSAAVQRASKFLNYQPSLFVYDYRDNHPQRRMNPRISLFTKEFPSDMFLLNLRTAAGASRGVPGGKALMILQNLGHFNKTTHPHQLGSDLKIYHFSVPTDLVGDSMLSGHDPDEHYDTRTGTLSTGRPFEVSSFTLHF